MQNIVFHRYCHIDTHTRLKIHTYTWMMIHTNTDTGYQYRYRYQYATDSDTILQGTLQETLHVRLTMAKIMRDHIA